MPPVPDPIQKPSAPSLLRLAQWYYLTRAIGAMMVVYGLIVDKTPERGTIILSGVGLLGFDKVARSDAVVGSKDK